jgi:hypothetical protein
LRNLHPSKKALLPVGQGWARLVYPGVTTRLPDAVLHLPAVRSLLTQRLVARVDAGWDADERQRRSDRAGMSELVRLAEQAQFDRLLAGARLRRSYQSRGLPRKRRADEWPEEWTARLKERWAQGATGSMIAAELGVSPGAVGAQVARQGLARRYRRHDLATPVGR